MNNKFLAKIINDDVVMPALFQDIFLQAFAAVWFSLSVFLLSYWSSIVNLTKIIRASNYMKLNELLQSLVELVHVNTYCLFILLLAPIFRWMLTVGWNPDVGEKGVGISTGKPLHYKGSTFHRIIKGFMAQVC